MSESEREAQRSRAAALPTPSQPTSPACQPAHLQAAPRLAELLLRRRLAHLLGVLLQPLLHPPARAGAGACARACDQQGRPAAVLCAGRGGHEAGLQRWALGEPPMAPWRQQTPPLPASPASRPSQPGGRAHPTHLLPARLVVRRVDAAGPQQELEQGVGSMGKRQLRLRALQRFQLQGSRGERDGAGACQLARRRGGRLAAGGGWRRRGTGPRTCAMLALLLGAVNGFRLASRLPSSSCGGACKTHAALGQQRCADGLQSALAWHSEQDADPPRSLPAVAGLPRGETGPFRNAMRHERCKLTSL